MRLAPAALLLATGCAAALHEPPPVTAPGGAAGGPGAPELLAEAEASFSRRPDPGAVRRADELFAAAAAADPAGVDGLAGAVRAKAWLAEHERDPAAREALAVSAVHAGQWCLRRAPASAPCEYALAIGLGLQARERPSTAADGLALMVKALRRAAAADPRLDSAGPHRVLALVLLRAPSWPLGPGDPEAGLAEAREAVALFPDYPPNQLALAEALLAGDSSGAARDAAEKALALAEQRQAAGDPDAADWARQAGRLLAR